MKTNPFPALDLRVLDIRDRLELVSDQNLFGFAIRHALNEKRPTSAIIEMIMDQYKDNPEMMADIVGYETIQLIKRVYQRN